MCNGLRIRNNRLRIRDHGLRYNGLRVLYNGLRNRNNGFYGFVIILGVLAKNKFEVLRTGNFDVRGVKISGFAIPKNYFWQESLIYYNESVIHCYESVIRYKESAIHYKESVIHYKESVHNPLYIINP